MNKYEEVTSIVERVDYKELVEQGRVTLMCELTGDNDVQIEFDNGNAIFRMRVLIDEVPYTEWKRFAWTGERDSDLQYAVGQVLNECEEELINYIKGKTI